MPSGYSDVLADVFSGWAVVLDAKPKFNLAELRKKPDSELTDEEHDALRHPNGYNPETDTCIRRDRVKKEDDLGTPPPVSSKFQSYGKEDENVVSYSTQAVKKNGKWVEKKVDEKGKTTRDDHDKFGVKKKGTKLFALPIPESEKEVKPTPYLDSFADVPLRKGTYISDLSTRDLYLRSKKPRKGAKKKEAQYDWTRNGQPLSPEEALRVEGALKELKASGALNKDSTNVKVRPDICNSNSVVAQWDNKANETHVHYGKELQEKYNRGKYRRVNKLYKIYDKVKARIYQGVKEDNPCAWLAYFMLRTKVRVGSSSTPTGGKGATNLKPENLALSSDGESFMLSFNGKSKRWWHVKAKDPLLLDYFKRRLKDVKGKKTRNKLFRASYNKLCDYLKEISVDLTGDSNVFFRPHDFRRLGATRVADQYIKEHLEGINPREQRAEWENGITEAVVAAAQHLNDTPDVAFKVYILPNILMRASPEDIVRYYPYLKESDL